MRPPAGFVRGLRHKAQDDRLTLVFDEESALESGGPVWRVIHVGANTNRRTCVLTWRAPLDGNLNRIAFECRRKDYRFNGGREQWQRTIETGYERAKESKQRSRRNTIEGWASHARRAIQMLDDGTG